MRGPFWNPKTGVTGENNSVTFVDDDGKTRTLVGQAAIDHRVAVSREMQTS